MKASHSLVLWMMKVPLGLQLLYHMNVRQEQSPPLRPNRALNLTRELPILGQDNILYWSIQSEICIRIGQLGGYLWIFPPSTSDLLN